MGQALIAAVYQTADELGASKTYWQTHERNYRARGLYDKLGKKSEFILYERELHVWMSGLLLVRGCAAVPPFVMLPKCPILALYRLPR